MKIIVVRLCLVIALVACGGRARPQVISNRAAAGDAPAPGNADPDGDGIVDFDACDFAPEDFDGFADSDGCPDPDNDKDLVLDVDDVCPDDPEDMDQDSDQDGCPEQAP